jgi:hypothetical protein
MLRTDLSALNLEFIVIVVVDCVAFWSQEINTALLGLLREYHCSKKWMPIDNVTRASEDAIITRTVVIATVTSWLLELRDTGMHVGLECNESRVTWQYPGEIPRLYFGFLLENGDNKGTWIIGLFKC